MYAKYKYKEVVTTRDINMYMYTVLLIINNTPQNGMTFQVSYQSGFFQLFTNPGYITCIYGTNGFHKI